MRRLWNDRGGRLALSLLLSLVLIGAGADLLSSDLPLAVRVDGVTYWIPCVLRPAALRNESQLTLGPRAEWMVRTPIHYGPLQTVAVTGEDRPEPLPWAPDEQHWLGTDSLGRDVAARLIHGARVSLFVGLLIMLIAVGVGMLIGGVSGYAGGAVDAALSRLLEVMQTFPTVFFLLTIFSLMPRMSLLPLVIALGLTRWTEVARLVRAEVLSLETREFVLAARALGASPARIIGRHLLPNALGPVMVVATFGVGSAILLETALSFLGIGVSPPTASWGQLLHEAHQTLQYPGAWWLAVFPGLAIALTVLTVNALGEAVRRALGGSVDGRP